jgi:hypothetical protein
VGVLETEPNPETIEVLLDTTWRVAGIESQRTDALDRKAAAVATFASVLATLTATLGVRFVEQLDAWWALTLFAIGLVAFLAAVALALSALRPREYLTLGIAYLERFPTWGEIRKSPDQVRGTTMRGLVQAIAFERDTNVGKAAAVRRSFALLVAGLALVGVEAVTLAAKEVVG